DAFHGAGSQHLRKHSGGGFRGSTNEPPSFTCCVDGDWETTPVTRISGAVSLSNAFSRLGPLERARTNWVERAARDNSRIGGAPIFHTQIMKLATSTAANVPPAPLSAARRLGG